MDQKIIGLLDDLFEFAPPERLRRTLLHLYFNCAIASQASGVPMPDMVTEDFHYLIDFIQNVESQRKIEGTTS